MSEKSNMISLKDFIQYRIIFYRAVKKGQYKELEQVEEYLFKKYGKVDISTGEILQ